MTTKFDIDEEVYCLHNNKVAEFKVVKITIKCQGNIMYEMQNAYTISLMEGQIFKTKQELIDSL